MRSKVVLAVVAAAAFVGAALAVFFAIPRAGNQPETTASDAGDRPAPSM